MALRRAPAFRKCLSRWRKSAVLSVLVVSRRLRCVTSTPPGGALTKSKLTAHRLLVQLRAGSMLSERVYRVHPQTLVILGAAVWGTLQAIKKTMQRQGRIYAVRNEKEWVDAVLKANTARKGICACFTSAKESKSPEAEREWVKQSKQPEIMASLNFVKVPARPRLHVSHGLGQT